MSDFDLAKLTDEERAAYEMMAEACIEGDENDALNEAIAFGVRIGRRLERGELLGGPSVWACELKDEDRGDWQPDAAGSMKVQMDLYLREWVGQFPADADDIRVRRYVRVPDDDGEGAGS